MARPLVAAPADSDAVRREMLEVYAKLADLGYLVGTWGNISMRVAEGLLVTPSRVPLEEMGIPDLVLVSMEGKTLKGRRLPSSEMHLHRMVLLKRPDIGALVHSHSPYASAVACAHRAIPVLMEDMSQILGGEVACAPYVPAGRHEDLGRAASEAIGDASMAVLLGNHGPVVGGRNLAEALVAAQVLEKAARSLIYTTVLGGAVEIPAESVASERFRFLYKYGTTDDKAGS
jgi:L-ribulose-5-phosphate 4-epimerase